MLIRIKPGVAVPPVRETRLLSRRLRQLDYSRYESPAWTRRLSAAKHLAIKAKLAEIPE